MDVIGNVPEIWTVLLGGGANTRVVWEVAVSAPTRTTPTLEHTLERKVKEDRDMILLDLYGQPGVLQQPTNSAACYDLEYTVLQKGCRW